MKKAYITLIFILSVISIKSQEVNTWKTIVPIKITTELRSDEINDTSVNYFGKIAADIIDEKSIVFTDQSTSYVDISKFVDIHISAKLTRETTTQALPWTHIAISNAKRNFLGIYHKIKRKYLQLYLDEFCYKLNRRYFGEKLFDRLTIAMTTN